MTTLITTDGTIEFSNKNIQPLTNCPRCQSTNLVHDFTAGYMSDQYSSSTCNDCGMGACFTMGFWHYNLQANGLEVWWLDVPEHLRKLFAPIAENPIHVDGVLNGEEARAYVKELPLTASLDDIRRAFEEHAVVKVVEPPSDLTPVVWDDEDDFPVYDGN